VPYKLLKLRENKRCTRADGIIFHTRSNCVQNFVLYLWSVYSSKETEYNGREKDKLKMYK